MKTDLLPRAAAFFIVLALAAFVPAVAAAQAGGAGGAITVEDAEGRTVRLPEVPSRIVLTGRANIMLVDALYLFRNVSERVVAVGRTNQGIGDFFPVLDAAPEEKARLGRSAGAEEILAHDPDLVLLKSQMRDSVGRALETAGAVVLYLDLETPEQYACDIRTLGAVLDQEQRAEEIVSLFDDRTRRLREQLDGVGRPEVLVLSYARSGEAYSFRVSPDGWIQTEQVRLAGAEPVWMGAAGSPGWNRIEFEQIAAWDPEVIIFISYRTDAAEPLRRIRDNPLWAELQAVENGEIYAMPADYCSWGQPDTRWILGAEWMAAALHGERFSEPFEARVRRFFSEFYGIGEAAYEREIAPRLSGDLLD